MAALTAGPDLELEEAWVDGLSDARWRSASAHGPSTGARSSGSSVLEVPPGCRLPQHTDSAEETVVVVEGTAELEVAGRRALLSAKGVGLVPADAPHEVRNVGEGPLRFVAVYADSEVVTRYVDPVQPDGSRERRPVS